MKPPPQVMMGFEPGPQVMMGFEPGPQVQADYNNNPIVASVGGKYCEFRSELEYR